MSKKMSNFFDVPELDEINQGLEQVQEEINREDENETSEDKEKRITTALAKISEFENQLAELPDISAHDKDMDEIASKALEDYRFLLERGAEAEDHNAGKIFDSAIRMMENALKAKDSKVSARLKKMDLMLKAQKIAASNKSNSNLGTESEESGRIIASRGDILGSKSEDKE